MPNGSRPFGCLHCKHGPSPKSGFLSCGQNCPYRLARQRSICGGRGRGIDASLERAQTMVEILQSAEDRIDAGFEWRAGVGHVTPEVYGARLETKCD